VGKQNWEKETEKDFAEQMDAPSKRISFYEQFLIVWIFSQVINLILTCCHY
jgi:hypothetical protein